MTAPEGLQLNSPAQTDQVQTDQAQNSEEQTDQAQTGQKQNSEEQTDSESKLSQPDLSNISLMGLFCMETETQVAALNQHLIALEQSGASAGKDHIDALMRAAHSIKGAARIVQVEAAVKVAHALEDCFIAAQQNILTLTGDRIDVLLMGVDLLSKLGHTDEQSLSEQLPQYDTDVDDVVIAIEAMVSAAEKTDSQEQTAEPTVSNPKAPDLKQFEPQLEKQQIESQKAAQPNLEQENAEAQKLPSSADEPAGSTQTTTVKPKPAGDDANRMIRISADNLSRLMGLAGELLVESNRLQPFADSLLTAKRKQQSALSLLKQQTLKQTLQEQPDNALSAATSALQSCHSLLSDRLSDVEQFSRRFGQLSERLYREVVAGHMCAFEEGIHGYRRLVRDTAKQQGKQVSLEITGLSTQIDRDILSKLDTPITHLLINAITHGVESPDVRLEQGKPAQARLKLSAAHRSGMLIVELEDDGAGIDFARLRQKVVAKGLVAASVVDQLSQSELIEFLFLPGFSTAAQVDDLAGRGYGLDLARTMAQSVGGSLTAISPLASTSGSSSTSSLSRCGTRFQFHLPLTLSVVRSLLFEAADEAYAVSLSRISRVVKLTKDQVHYSENRPYFRLDEENISLISIRQILALNGSLPDALSQDNRLSVVVLGEAGARYGLCVDQLLEEKDLVVRPLDSRLGKVPNISAAALSETGAPILILDVADVLRSAEKATASEASYQISRMAIAKPTDKNDAHSKGKVASADSQKAGSREAGSRKAGSRKAGSQKIGNQKAARQKKVLVVDDSMTVRAMEKKLLQNRGYAVDIAVDGAEGWNAVRMENYDLVITDVDMPRMSGIELIRKMREYETTKKLPVIVVSYKDREADQLAGLDAGANYYLTKSSFHDDGLITAVVDLIGS